MNTTRLLTLATSTLLLLSAGAHAADSKMSKKKTDAPGKSESYKIDTKASTVTWTASKATGSSHTGNIAF